MIYGILQKDFVLYMGIKLGMSGKGKISTIGTTVFKVTLIVTINSFPGTFKNYGQISRSHSPSNHLRTRTSCHHFQHS
jgi:hypothetical protein